jgi:hypothetical protein
MHLLLGEHCTWGGVKGGGAHETPVPVGLSTLVLPVPIVLAVPLHDTPSMRLHVMQTFP